MTKCDLTDRVLCFLIFVFNVKELELPVLAQRFRDVRILSWPHVHKISTTTPDTTSSDNCSKAGESHNGFFLEHSCFRREYIAQKPPAIFILSPFWPKLVTFPFLKQSLSTGSVFTGLAPRIQGKI